MKIASVHMAIWLFSLLLFSYQHDAKAQVISDSIQFHSESLGYYLAQGPMKIGRNRVEALTKNCTRAWETYKMGKQMESFGFLLISGGIACTAAALGGHYFSEQPISSTPLIFAGITMVGLGIPIGIGGVKKVKSFVFIYNQDCIRQ